MGCVHAISLWPWIAGVLGLPQGRHHAGRLPGSAGVLVHGRRLPPTPPAPLAGQEEVWTQQDLLQDFWCLLLLTAERLKNDDFAVHW